MSTMFQSSKGWVGAFSFLSDRGMIRVRRRGIWFPRLRTRLGDRTTQELNNPKGCVGAFIVDLRINGTHQTGPVRKTKLPFYRLVGAVSNCADSVRLETAPTGGRKCSSVFNIHHSFPVGGISKSRHPTVGAISRLRFFKRSG